MGQNRHALRIHTYETLPSNEYGIEQSQTNFKMERKHSVLQMKEEL
jgi:hypothetical protein